MASGVDLVLGAQENLRQTLSGTADFLQRQREQDARLDEVKRKQEADKVRQDRLEALGARVGDLNAKVLEDSNLTDEEFLQLAAPVSQGAIELGDPGLTRALDPLQQIMTNRRNQESQRLASNLASEKEAKREVKEDKDLGFKTRQEVRELGKNFSGNPITKKTEEVRQAFGKIDTLTEGTQTAVKDLALIFNFMRMQDPGSVVRESEFKTAADARAFLEKNKETGETWPAFLVQAFQRASTGSLLTPSQLEDFKSTAESLFKSQLNIQAKVDDQFSAQALDAKADIKKIIPRLSSEDLAELRTRQEAREKNKKRLVGSDGKTPGERESDGSGAKQLTISRQQVQSMATTPANQAEFEKRKGMFEQATGRAMTPEEQARAMNIILQQQGFEVGD